MWWQVVFKFSCLVTVASVPVAVTPDPFAGTMPGVNCSDYTVERLVAILTDGWRSKAPLVGRSKRSYLHIPTEFVPYPREASRSIDTIRIIDNLIPRGDYLVKEHAKLVHDINSLSQVIFVKPAVEEHRDYDDSVLQEVIETATTATMKPLYSSTFTTARPSSTTTKGSSLPVILVGGASQPQVIKSQPNYFPNPTVSLIGTTISPVIKHPYPFIVHRPPVKMCVTTLPLSPTPRPPVKTIWERILDYFIPRRKRNLLNK